MAVFSLPFSKELALELEKSQLSESKNYLLIYPLENPRGGGGGGSTPGLWAIGRGTDIREAYFAHVVCRPCNKNKTKQKKNSILHDRKVDC